jgi:hypothetical protein
MRPMSGGPHEALKHAESALRELDNLRWDDIWRRVDASGEGDDLARYSQKYLRYARTDLEKIIAALGRAASPPEIRIGVIARTCRTKSCWPSSGSART